MPPNPGALAREYSDILRWEMDSGVYDALVDGLPIWRLIRNSFIVNHTVRLGFDEPHRRGAAGVSGAAALAFGSLASLWDLKSVPAAEVAFWGFGRRQLTEAGYVDPFTDPVSDFFAQKGLSTLSFERPLEGWHLEPAVTSDLRKYDAPKILSRVAGWVPSKISPKEKETIAALAKLLSDKFDRPSANAQTLLSRELRAFRSEKKSALRLLAKVRPKAVFVVNRWINSGVLAACHDMDIPSYEFQHGVVGSIGFKYETPYCAGIDPSGFLTFGSEWLDKGWGLPKGRVLNAGAPNIWTQRAQRAAMPSGRKILLVSQPNLADQLNQAFVEICSNMPAQEFVLRVHPQDRRDLNKRYSCLALPNVSAGSAGLALYDQFADCQAVVGQDSTVLFEASFFNLKVGLLSLPGALQNGLRERIGDHNFFDASNAQLVSEMLNSPREAEARDGNGFFDPLQSAILMQLVNKEKPQGGSLV